MAGSGSIFRIDANGETEATARTANQIVEFNGTGLNPDDQSYLDSLNVEMIEDISLHPNPNRHLTQIQDGKFGTKIVTIKGFFKTPDTADGIARFNNWMIQDKTAATLTFGRFGLRYDNMSQFDLTPSSTVAYMLQYFNVKDVEEYQGKAEFTAILYLNGSPI